MKTAVITTGGLGTRLLTYSKSNPKTMLPLFERRHVSSETPLLRPLLEIIFENLFNQGFRKFCFIVGTKTQESIFRQMLPDPSYIKLLQKRNVGVDRRFIKTLTKMHSKMNMCKVHWVSQSTPMGFGHALLSASNFVGKDDFILHAGDAYFPKFEFIKRMIKKFEKEDACGMLLLQRRKCLKGYGIAQIDKNNNVYSVQEKPKKAKSNVAILPLYLFKSDIFDALKNTPNGHNNELQVTDAVKTLINCNKKIIGEFYKEKQWFDIGTPENYFRAFNYSYKN